MTGLSFDYLLYKLSNAFVSSVNHGQNLNGDDLVEHVAFTYAALEIDYLTIPGDQPGTTASASWTFCKSPSH
jgi:type VI protein secretion system component Hcp